ncbi:hypothetical protein BGZ50_004023 [Haplosporangium sp. Z 11]|nr:hypothetical protein BGZ50_004023 [Haplosporangium sp. Z 11]
MNRDSDGLFAASATLSPKPLSSSQGSHSSSRYHYDLQNHDSARDNPTSSSSPATATVSSPVPILSSTASHTPGASDSTNNNNISFSPLPIGRSNPEPQQARRLHEYTPSPARSLALMLENAKAAETQGHNSRTSQDQWVANASGATGSSSVHFQAQASLPAHASGRLGQGSVAWMGTSVPESRFSGFEVVYDDGVRKQRTFSLTTEQDDEERSSFDDDGSETSPLIGYQEAGPSLSTPNKRILKASLAYLFGCLVSFTPFFRPYVGASGHLAATCAVFFNPAKSLGRMVDAVTAGLAAITFGFLVCVASMLSAIWFNSRGLYVLGHVMSVIVFGGGSTFAIAFAKAHYNRPTVNVGKQDMGKSLSSFRLLLKLLTKTFLLEADTTPFGSDSVQKLIETQVKSFSALAKSLEEAQLEFPGADIKKYENCVKSLNTLAQYLNGLRSSCGLQYDMLKRDELRKEKNGSSQQQQHSPSTGAAGVLPGSGKRPLGFGVRMSSYSLIGSLNSADQEESASADLIEFLDHVGKPMKSLALTCKLTIEHLQDIFTSMDNEKQTVVGRSQSSRSRTLYPQEQQPRHQQQQQQQCQSGYESAEMFSDSTYDAGHSQSNHTQRPGHPTESFRRDPSLILMQINLAKALDIFENANSMALKNFYAQQNKRKSNIFRRPVALSKRMSEPTLQDMADEPQDTLVEKAPVGEQIFLVYFFVFNLMEFSKELSNLVGCVEDLVDGDEGLPLWIARNRQSWWRRIWFSITGFPRRLWRPATGRNVFENSDDPEPGLRPSNSIQSFQSHGSAPRSNSNQQPTSSSSNNMSASANNNGFAAGRKRKQKQRLFPKPNIHNTSNTLQTPIPETFAQRWSTRLWKFLHLFRSFQVKYAAKTAFTAMVMLVPAFLEWTRPYFVQYRGEWAIISMLVVMVPTVGGTNIVGVYRIISTIIGCYVGVAVYLLFPAHQIVLPICCFLFAIPNFYLVLCSKYPRLGQVTLLAYNLVLLQTYNRRLGDGTVPPDEDEDDDLASFISPTMMLRKMGSLLDSTGFSDPSPASDVLAIAFHRAVAVCFGVVVGVAVTSYVWPYEARVELRKGLSDLLLNISWLYNRLVSVYSTNLDRVSILPQQKHYKKSRLRFREMAKRTTFQERFQTPVVDEQLQQTKDGTGDMDIERMNKEFMAIELSLQLQLLRLYALLEETPNEPRLKGKFPVGTYKNMLGSCQNILDRFLSMRLVITKDEWLESARRDFIVPVNKERREMVGNVLLYFYTIASALRLKTPLPPYLPPANQARLRLIQKIRQLPVVQNKVVMTEDNDERYIFYYAYALVMDDVIRELERLGRWSQDLFGVITPAREFEAWFTDDGVIPPPMRLPQSSELPSSATKEAPMSPYTDIEEPYQYLAEDIVQSPPQQSQSPSQHQRLKSSSRSSSQQLVSTAGKYRYHPDENSHLLSGDGSNQGVGEDTVMDHEGMFSFDHQDPFRDSPSAFTVPEYGNEEGDGPISTAFAGVSQRQPQRQHRGSQGSRGGSVRSTISVQGQSQGRSYGSIQPSRNSGGSIGSGKAKRATIID